MRQATTVVILAALLSGCSTLSGWTSSLLGGSDNAEPPAPLVEIPDPIPLKQLWSTRVGVGLDKQFVNLEPFVYEDRVYVADRKGRVVALDAETGKEQWQVKTGAALSAGPGVGSGLVFLGTSDAEVLALRAEDGTLQWKAEVSSEVLAVPQVDIDKVIVQTADGIIAALAVDSGEQLWVNDRSVPVLTLRGTSTPAVESGLVVAGFANGKLVGLSAEKGFPVWEVSIAIPQGRSEIDRLVDIDGDPVIVGGVVYVTTYQGHIAVIEAQTGNQGWQREMSSNVGLGVDFSQVYVTDADSNVWALSRATGATEWKQDELAYRKVTAPTPFEDYVAVGDLEGYVHLLSRYDGHIAARARVDSKGIQEKPLAWNGTLYVYGNSGKLSAFRLPAPQ
ncbi:MAG: outer membrane protein assembly factor BamB [Gammaproteobacteria bacterium]|nr:outer membrane protein assembly factor BamB [Gammaproteobacteria bacterium]